MAGGIYLTHSLPAVRRHAQRSRLTGVQGVSDIQYGIPNMQIEYHAPEVGIPVTYWRSVGYSQNTFFTESFVDEMAAAGGKDPVEFRRRLLAKSPRYLAVLELAADKAGWGKPLPAGRFRGVAVVNNIGSFNAQVAEVSVTKGKVRVHRVVCAVDCGQVINPAIVEQQIQSGIVYGLSAALKGAITIDRGRVNRRTSTTTTSSASTRCRWWKCISFRARTSREESGRRARLRLFRRLPTPFSPPPGNVSASCPFVPKI